MKEIILKLDIFQAKNYQNYKSALEKCHDYVILVVRALRIVQNRLLINLFKVRVTIEKNVLLFKSCKRKVRKGQPLRKTLS